MTAPTVSLIFMEATFEYLSRQGINEAQVLREMGRKVKEKLLLNNRLPLRDYEQLLDIGHRLTGDTHFGLNMGASPLPRTWGLVSHLAMSAPNPTLALTALMNYSSLQLNFIHFSVDELKDEHIVVTLHFDTASRPNRHVIEHMFANIVELSSSQMGYSTGRVKIEFIHESTGCPQHVETVLNANVYFNCDTDRVYVPAQFLEQQARSGEKELYEATEQLARQQLMELRGEDRLINATREAILKQLPTGLPKLENIAAAQGLSGRTLQRQLQSRHVKFQMLLDEVRRELARQLIAAPELSLSEIANYLAFNDQSAFQHAFQRWEGVAPGKFRKSI